MEVTILEESETLESLEAATEFGAKRALWLLMQMREEEIGQNAHALGRLLRGVDLNKSPSGPVTLGSLVDVVSANSSLMSKPAVRAFMSAIADHEKVTRRGLKDIIKEVDRSADW